MSKRRINSEENIECEASGHTLIWVATVRNSKAEVSALGLRQKKKTNIRKKLDRVSIFGAIASETDENVRFQRIWSVEVTGFNRRNGVRVPDIFANP